MTDLLRALDWSHEVTGGNGFTVAKTPHEIDAAIIATFRNHIDALCRLALAVLPKIEGLRDAVKDDEDDRRSDTFSNMAARALLAAVDEAVPK